MKEFGTKTKQKAAALFCPHPPTAIVIDIVIPSFNCADKLLAAVESIRRGTRLGWRAFVVDNASEDGAREWLLRQPDLEVVCNETNVGFSRATNQGVAMSMRNPASEWTVLMNNDIVVPRDWDKTMLSALRRRRNRGVRVCSPLLFKPRGRHEPRDQVRRALTRWGRNAMVDVEWLGFCCTFVHKTVWQRYGLLRDDRRFWHWGSDKEFCRRLAAPYGCDGWRVCYYTGLGVLHFHSAARKYAAARRAAQAGGGPKQEPTEDVGCTN